MRCLCLRLTCPPPCAVLGILKGFDQMMNVVLENCVEYLRDPADPTILTDKTRHLGLVVCKGRCELLRCGGAGCV